MHRSSLTPRRLICALVLLFSASSAVPAAEPARVLLETSRGNIELELYPDKAPATVANFLEYVRSGAYDGTIFHRTVYDWIIQGGGYDTEVNEVETLPAIRNEADNGLKNLRGTIAMARTADPDSADSQFFINLADNDSLDHRAKTRRGWGYCVFGRVISGLEVAVEIGRAETAEHEYLGVNFPVEPVVIERASAMKPPESAGAD